MDTLNVVMPFREQITHILLKRSKDGKSLVGSADSKDGSISIGIESKFPVEDMVHGACLGSLSYLNNSLNSNNLKDSKMSMDLNFSPTSDKRITALRSIRITDSKKFEVFYQATDPFVSKLTKRKVVKITEWPIVFEITPSLIKDYVEAVKIQASAPNMGDRGEIFTLAYSEDAISLLFGEKGHQLTLTPDVDVFFDIEEFEPINKQSALFSKVQFLAVCQLLERIRRSKNGNGEAVGSFNEKALMVEFETTEALYTITLLAKKLLT